jgi:intergrase/recombinase
VAAPAPNSGQGGPSSYLSSSYFPDNSFWINYKEYLARNFNRHTAKCRLIYAKEYSHVLNKYDANDLLLLSNEKRIHVMKSLATLSKYLGCYDQWKKIIQRYQLKWSNVNNVEVFNDIMGDNGNSYNSMVEWLKNTYSKLSNSYGNILLYNTLTGLRPDEACKSIILLQKERDNYLRKDLMVLEHFKYPDIFLRRTKKAYISILTDSILEIAKQSAACGYNALRLAVKRKKLDMNMAFSRKIFATHLRNNGIGQEVIDLLQGRTPRSVFARHYYRPDFDYDKVREIVNSLLDKFSISNLESIRLE